MLKNETFLCDFQTVCKKTTFFRFGSVDSLGSICLLFRFPQGRNCRLESNWWATFLFMGSKQSFLGKATFTIMEQDGRLSKLQGKNGKNNRMFWQKKNYFRYFKDPWNSGWKSDRFKNTSELKLKNWRKIEDKWEKKSVKNGKTSSNTSKIIQKNKKSNFQSEKKYFLLKYQGTKMIRKGKFRASNWQIQ